MDCKIIHTRLFHHVYQILDELDAAAVRAHLDECETCRKEATTIKTLLHHLKRGAVLEPVPEVVKERIRSGIQRKVG